MPSAEKLNRPQFASSEHSHHQYQTDLLPSHRQRRLRPSLFLSPFLSRSSSQVLIDDNLESGDFTKQPDEILIQIFSHFKDPKNLKSLFLVCRRWHRILHENGLWRRICHNKGWRPLPNLLQIIQNWQLVFKTHCLLKRNWRQGRCQVRSISQIAERQLIEPFTGPCLAFDDGWVLSMKFSPEEQAKVWNLKTGECVVRLRGHQGSITAAQFNANGIITGSMDSTIKIFTRQGVCLQTLTGHEKEINCLHFDKDVLLSGSEDSTLRIWDLNQRQVAVLEGHQGPVCCVQLFNDKIASGSADTTIKIWDFATRQCEKTLEGHSKTIFCVKFTKDHIISGSEDASVKVWSQRTGSCLKTLRGHHAAVVCLQLDETQQQLITGSADHTVKVWDLHSGHSLYTLKHHSSPIWNIHVSPTQLITSAMDRSLLIHDFTTHIMADRSSDIKSLPLLTTASSDISY